MALVLFDGIAVSNTSGAAPATLVIDPRYYIHAQPEIRTVKPPPKIRTVKS